MSTNEIRHGPDIESYLANICIFEKKSFKQMLNPKLKHIYPLLISVQKYNLTAKWPDLRPQLNVSSNDNLLRHAGGTWEKD